MIRYEICTEYTRDEQYIWRNATQIEYENLKVGSRRMTNLLTGKVTMGWCHLH